MGKPKLEPRECRHCGAGFMARSHDVRKGWGLFCSNSCRASWHKEEKSVRWKGGHKLANKRYVENGKSAAQKRRWYAENVETERQRFREVSRKRKQLKDGNRLPSGTVLAIGEQQRWRCAVCRKGIRKAYHMDHIIPLAGGGQHTPRNIQLLCAPCNLAKAAKQPEIFMRERGLLL